MKKKKSEGREEVSSPTTIVKQWEKHIKTAKSHIRVDFPVEGEILTSPRYTVRLTATGDRGIEISIDGKSWRPCRESVGFWWFDWDGYAAGPHTIQARAPVSGKRHVKSDIRQFTVLI